MQGLDDPSSAGSTRATETARARLFGRRWRIAAGISAIDVTVASAFALAGLLHPQAIVGNAGVLDGGTRVFALYAAARTFPLALATGLAIWRGSLTALLVLGGLAGTIQLADAAVGLACGDAGKTLGPLLIAGCQAWAIVRLAQARRQPMPTAS